MRGEVSSLKRYLLVLVGLTALSAASVALAAPARDATVEASPFFKIELFLGPGSEDANCPGERFAVGGGAVQSGSPAGVQTLASTPLDATGLPGETRDGDRATQWRAALELTSDNPSATRRVKTFALCSALTDARIETTRFKVPRLGQGDGFAVCPQGKRALGGGVTPLGPTTGLYIAASGPLDATGVTLNTDDGDRARQWYAAVGEHSHSPGDPPREAKVFAICSTDSRATIAAGPLKTSEFPKSVEEMRTGHARCAAGERLTGGGIVQSGELGPNVQPAVGPSGPLDATGITAETKDGDRATQWYAGLRAYGDDRVKFRVFAICEPG